MHFTRHKMHICCMGNEKRCSVENGLKTKCILLKINIQSFVKCRGNAAAIAGIRLGCNLYLVYPSARLDSVNNRSFNRLRWSQKVKNGWFAFPNIKRIVKYIEQSDLDGTPGDRVI